MNFEQTIDEVFNHLLARHPGLVQKLPLPLLPLSEQTSIEFGGEFQSHPLSAAINKSFYKAIALSHALPDWIVRMPGMSGKKYRYFINNLVKEVSNPRYLEVGSWAGSTACSAMYGNLVNTVCIDNWSQFGGPKEQFIRNISVAKGESEFQFFEKDFRLFDFNDLNFEANIFLFDGPHEEQDQYDGIALAVPSLQDDFVLIVDDYNWGDVRRGTQRAIHDCSLSVQSYIEVKTTIDGSHPKLSEQNSDWHNGYFIAHVRKK